MYFGHICVLELGAKRSRHKPQSHMSARELEWIEGLSVRPVDNAKQFGLLSDRLSTWRSLRTGRFWTAW